MKLATNFQDLVAKVKNLVALAPVLGTILRPGYTPVSRSFRRLTRNTGWWENGWNNYSEAGFKKTFRTSRSTFRYILPRIGPFLARGTVKEDCYC